MNIMEEAIDSRSEYFDSKLGVYNQKGFSVYGAKMLTAYPEQDFAIVRLDIHHFKLVREYVGHLEADKFINNLVVLIKSFKKDKWVVSHFGGDVFSLLIPFETINEIFEIVEEMIFDILDYDIPCQINPAFGIFIVENHYEYIDYMNDCAKLALDTIKGNYEVHYAVFDSEMRQQILRNRRIETRTKDAISNKEFKAFFQPQINMTDGTIIGVEALVRWQNPRDGMIFPNEFIPVFEKNGFILDMDFAVWEDAFISFAAWKKNNLSVPHLVINVSGFHKINNNFVRKLSNLCLKYDVNPEWIVLEISADYSKSDNADRLGAISLLRDMGFSIAYDNYGGEFSVEVMIENSDIDMVSLDKNLVKNINKSDRANIFIDRTIRLLGDMGIKIYAEGIEKKEQADFLIERGCVFGQGYMYYEPMSAKHLEAMLSNQ